MTPSRLWARAAVLGLLTAATAHAGKLAKPGLAPKPAQPYMSLTSVAVPFIENVGQYDPNVAFSAARMLPSRVEPDDARSPAS